MIRVLFVLSNGENGGSFLFGSSEKACFLSENPSTLYHFPNDRDQRTLFPWQPSFLAQQQHYEELKLAEGEKLQTVNISYELYSYFIFWLLEEGYVAYPSELLVSILQQSSSSYNDKTFKEILKKEIGKSSFEEVKIGTEELYSFVSKKNKDKKRVGPKGVKVAKLMQQALKEICLIHLRGGWFPSINEKLKGGLGSRCRSVLFASGKHMRVSPSSPLFDQKTDGPLICIVNFEEKGRRVYFDPRKPSEIHCLVNRMVADASMPEGKHCIGVEDQSSYFVVPLREGDDHPLAHMFTQKKIDQDKRFKQLIQDLTPGKTKVERLMPQDTKVVTYHEYLYFISALKACQTLAGVPEDLFEHLYTNFIIQCKPYTPITMISYLAKSGWRNMTIKRSRENQQIIDQMGLAHQIGTKNSVHIWFHVKPPNAGGQDFFEEDGDIRFILSPHEQRKLSKILNVKKNFFPSFMQNVKLKADQTDEDYYNSVIDPLCDKLQISTSKFSSKQKKKSRISNDSSDDDEGVESDDADFIVNDDDEEDVSEEEEEDEDEADRPLSTAPSGRQPTNLLNTGGLYLKAIREAVQAAHNRPNVNTEQKKNQEEVIQLQTGVTIPLPPRLPVLSIADPIPTTSRPPNNKIYTGIVSDAGGSSNPSDLHQAQNSNKTPALSDPRWLSKLTLDQGTFLSSESIWNNDTEFTSKMISYTKHNFAPQLYSKGIKTILQKVKQDELQLRLFIMMIIERGEAEIRHLSPQPEGKMLEDIYTATTSKEIDEDLHQFVYLFSQEFLSSDPLSVEETALLCRCYCAHWMFVKQLYRTKQEAFYLQLYEFKEWIPILFSSNIPTVSSSMQIKYDSIKLDVPLQKTEGQALVAIIPSISDLLGSNTRNRTRGSARTSAYKFSEFLDAFFLKYGPNASIELQQKYCTSGTGFPNFINRTFYFDTSESLQIHSESLETSCFTDLLYFAAVHWLKRGNFVYNCKACRRQMLRYFLEKVCLLNEGLIKFIEYLVNMEDEGIARIPGVYAWLLLVYLKHDLGDLREKSFNDMITAARNKCMDQLAQHIQKNKSIEQDAPNTTNIKYFFDIKYDMEMKFTGKKIREVVRDDIFSL
jgi:hypothetical protein